MTRRTFAFYPSCSCRANRGSVTYVYLDAKESIADILDHLDHNRSLLLQAIEWLGFCCDFTMEEFQVPPAGVEILENTRSLEEVILSR